ncbi:ATP-binding protein [Noviherbaspirillum galbum]|uniref:ATP-binding protein n=1 Tax=Noviherbaspirillum galbum TaxID=2709383 RepID=A0A6B3SWK0_9BURK|nr:ATP-binding protein [Noviherbaspirillum galbum]NEX64901.1 ATP-binding protein [Noviherbaspirillum galbum]
MENIKQRLWTAGQNLLTNRASKTRNGILLFGPPGCGKTYFAQALAGQLDLPLISITSGDLASRWINESTENLVQVFREAAAQAPCVLFFDEFESVAEHRARHSSSGEGIQMVNTLLAEIVKLRRHRVILIAATNYMDRLDPAVIREGRFDFKIEVPPPDFNARRAILEDAIVQHMGLGYIEGDTITLAAQRWEGFSVKRLQAVAEQIPEVRQGIKFATIDYPMLCRALRLVQGHKGKLPEQTKSISELVFAPPFTERLQGILYRLREVEQLQGKGGTAPTGILFSGPPGTGKTEAARALAKDSSWAFLATTGQDLLVNPCHIDELVSEAMELRPAIIFIDEADDVLLWREASSYASVTNKLLTVMDGAKGRPPDLVFIAATNYPERLDPAALRGGRFTEKLQFHLPSQETLARYIDRWCQSSVATFDPVLLPETLASILKGQSIANVAAILQEAINIRISRRAGRDLTPVNRSDVMQAMNTIVGASQSHRVAGTRFRHACHAG